MRAVEVSFIRDCAEMAARASLTRTESRWGLYHDRADLPDRDDRQWAYHLILRKDGNGDMQFLKRPVAPYFIPVAGLDTLPPADQTVRVVPQPALVGGRAPTSTTAPKPQAPAPTDPPSSRIAEVLACEHPSTADLAAYLGDPDPRVRRTAVAILTEHTPTDYAPALLAALDDDDPGSDAPRPTGSANLSKSCRNPLRPSLICILRMRLSGQLQSMFWPRAARAPPVTTAAHCPTLTTGCASRLYARWYRSTTLPGLALRSATTTAKSASLRPTAWPPCGPAPTPSALWSPTPTRWCGRQPSLRWVI